MISPGDEEINGKPALFVSRWNSLVKVLIAEPSIKLVARTAVDYALFDGVGVFPGNERLARETGLDERTIRNAWAFLRGVGMARRIECGNWDGGQRTADAYTLEIPENWRSLPILGPASGRFTCQQCGRLFNPRAGHSIREGDVFFTVPRMVFCPDGTKGSRKGKSCFEDWQADRRRQKLPVWSELGNDVCWKIFREARHDDWS